MQHDATPSPSWLPDRAPWTWTGTPDRIRTLAVAMALLLLGAAEQARGGDEPPAAQRDATAAGAIEAPLPEAPPASMARIVVRSAIDWRGSSPDEKPKTLYRAGERWGRIEHPKNPKTGVHPIVIVASPDAWFVDRARKTAEHFRDPGPTYRFRAPIVERTPDLPEALEELEFGREFAFLDAHGATRRREQSDRKKADIHTAELDGITVELSTKPDSRKPLAIVVRRDRTVLAAYRYEDYREGIRTDPKLFAPPKGIRVVPAAPGAPAAR